MSEIKEVVTPSASQVAWHDLELGMFIHFDIPVYAPEWQWRSWKDIPDPNVYQPEKLDTDQWMEAAKAMGAKYAIFVAKHCSGFLQWQTDLYPYGVKQSSWRGGKGDVVADFIASCEKYDIKPGLYASVTANAFLEIDNPGLVNRGQGGDAARQAEYVRLCERMTEELWTRYGKLFEIWFDGGAIPTDEGGPALIPLLQKHQPESIVFQGPPGTPNMIRWVGNERGVAPYPCWSTANSGTAEDGDTEKRFHGKPDGKLWLPGECDVPVRNHEWFWKPGQDGLLYSVDELMEMYYHSVGRNCNLLLNANPGPDGLIPEADFNRYAEFGREIRRRFETPLAETSGQGDVVELDLGQAQQVNHVAIMEDIAQGERVLEYAVEVRLADGTWQKACEGLSVGHKRLQQFDTVKCDQVKLRVSKAKATPQIRKLAAYFVD